MCCGSRRRVAGARRAVEGLDHGDLRRWRACGSRVEGGPRRRTRRQHHEAVGLLALVANGSVLAFLSKRRHDDINMRSAWLCSRNDVIANMGVLVAAGAVALTGSAWPDIGMGLLIATLFGVSAIEVIRSARRARVASLTTAR
jgi:Cation efflux family